LIRASRVNLRAGPSQESKVVQVLSHDTPVYPERSLEMWQLVRTPDGRVGWVHGSLLVASP
jgi:SH3-like domain-containing protein